MKCPRRIEAIVVAAALSFGACSGAANSRNQDDNPPTDELPPIGPDSLLRNPEHPLSCDQPLAANPSSSQLSRLTHQQYINTLRDLFEGLVSDSALPDLQDFSDELKEGLFTNNVMGQLGSEGITQAREAAVLAITDEAAMDLPKLMACQPKDSAGEQPCVQKFIEAFGLRMWRRPLTGDELKAVTDFFVQARKDLDYADSVRAVLGAMLQSPQFLYRIQAGDGEVNKDLGKRLSDYEIASSLSYLIWNTMPDSTLFSAAKNGELRTTDQLEKQARRMLDDPRAHENVRQFQHEWLRVERLETQARAGVKDPKVFPRYTAAQSDALALGFDAFLENAFWKGDHSLKNFFTSSHGFVNDASAEIYGVAKPGNSEVVAVDLDPTQRQGVLTQPFVMAGWASDIEQSAILRGAFVMDDILCAPAPPPPMNVERKILAVPDRSKVTLRQVVEMTVEQGSCAGCHKMIDGFGFLYENYSGIGAYQTKDGAINIDASNEVMGTFDLDGHYDNAVQFAGALAKSAQAAQCAVQVFYEFATGRHGVPEDGCVIAPLTDAFIKNGTNMQQLVIDMVKSPAFRYRTVAQ